LTSDGETYNVVKGKGGYTAASALEWTTMLNPSYCKGDEVKIPIKILKRNYGKILGDELILLKVGEKSKVITHPVMDEIKFTLTVQSVDEKCS